MLSGKKSLMNSSLRVAVDCLESTRLRELVVLAVYHPV